MAVPRRCSAFIFDRLVILEAGSDELASLLSKMHWVQALLCILTYVL
jgi:hypothetical protein